jgi:ketosteroid isomerase-like protein
MARYLLHHRHEPDECGVVFAPFKGHHSPLRHRPTLASCRSGGPADVPRTTEPDRRRTAKGKRRRTMDRYRGLLERYVELYNAGDLDGVMDLYAEDAVQLMPDGTFEGRSAIRDRLAKELAAFADIAHRYVSYVEQGDAFADEWVFVGTHTGPLLLPDGTELAATGKRVEMPGMEFVKVRDGKILVDNLYYDNLAVAAQFGLLSRPATT